MKIIDGKALATRLRAELKEKIEIPCEQFSGSIKEVAEKLYPSLKSGDIVIGLGAGTITNLGKELLTLNKE